MKTEPNSPAFARASFYHPDGSYDPPQEGLTTREYYAGLAMEGLLANRNFSYDTIPSYAVKIADKLIEELNKEKL